MTLVVDASIVLKLFFPEPGSDRAQALFTAPEPRLAPDLIVPEVCNAVWRKIRLGEMPAEAAPSIIADLEPLFDELAPSLPLAEQALRLATELDHPTYDCFYLALAESRGATLVTADRRLLASVAGSRFGDEVSDLTR